MPDTRRVKVTMPERERQAAIERAAEEQAESGQPERLGDVLGLSEAPPEVEIPRATADRGGNPAGIEVRTPGHRNLPQSKGATGIQMGAAGSGTDIEPDSKGPLAADRDVND